MSGQYRSPRADSIFLRIPSISYSIIFRPSNARKGTAHIYFSSKSLYGFNPKLGFASAFSRHLAASCSSASTP